MGFTVGGELFPFAITIIKWFQYLVHMFKYLFILKQKLYLWQIVTWLINIYWFLDLFDASIIEPNLLYCL